MSVCFNVFLTRAKLPSPSVWAQAIRANGFEVDLDTDFDMQSSEGFRPCRYRGRDGGFEYSCAEIDRDALDEEVADAVADCDVVVTFATHSDFRELATSVVASSVLCALAGGILDDESAGELIAASEVIERARRSLPEIEAQFGD